MNGKDSKETNESKQTNSNGSSSDSSTAGKPVKKSIKRLAVLESMPVVELSSHSGNLFESGPNEEEAEQNDNPFTAAEQQTLANARETVFMIDVEACDALNGPVLAVGCVLGVYKDYMKYEILRREQWIIDRSINDCSAETKRFWLGAAHGAWTYFTTSNLRMPEEQMASGFRHYLNLMWKYVPNLCIMVDSVHVDLTLLNNLLVKHKHKPLHYDHQGKYQHSIYVSRDLLRGSYAAIDSTFSILQQPGLNKAINECWKRMVGYGNRIHISHKAHDANQHGRMEKHYPVWDSAQVWTLRCQMEDIRMHYEMRFPRVSMTYPAYPTYVPMLGHQQTVQAQPQATLSLSQFPPLLSPFPSAQHH
jgi:hypothetical protein